MGQAGRSTRCDSRLHLRPRDVLTPAPANSAQVGGAIARVDQRLLGSVSVRLLGNRGPARRRRMRHHAPELTDDWQAEAPSAGRPARPDDGLSRRAMLGDGRPMRVDQEVRVERDHRFLRIQSLLDARSSGSTPGGRPPSTVTHRMLDRAAGSLRRSPRNSRRRPRSTRARSVVRDSAARFFAATKRSSGSSMVVFIWLHRIPNLWSTPHRRDIGDAGNVTDRCAGRFSVDVRVHPSDDHIQ